MEYRELLSFFFLVSLAAIALLFFLAQARGNESQLKTEKDRLLQEKNEQAQLLNLAYAESAAWKKKLEDSGATLGAKEKQLEEATQQAKQYQTEIGILRQLCAEMPITKQRVLDLERSLAIEQDRFNRFQTSSTYQVVPATANEEPETDLTVPLESLVPDLEEGAEDEDEDLPPFPLITANASEPSVEEKSELLTDDGAINQLKQQNQLLQFTVNQLKKKLAVKKFKA